jgi:hypothetical protein
MRELEKEVLKRVEAELAIQANALAKSGHTCRAPEIENWSSDSGSYTSELRVTILKSGQIEDVLEFHVFLDGEAQVSGNEVAEWIRTQLLAIVDQSTAN